MQVFFFNILFITTLFAEDLDSVQYEFTLVDLVITFIFVFLLAILFKIKRENTELKKRSEINDLRQNGLLSEMGENIDKMLQETINHENVLSKKIEDKSVGEDIQKVISSEKKLLDMTINLIEFLRLKSKKVEVQNNEFKFANLLNDISGGLITKHEGSNVEIIYDVDSDIPYILISDTLKLSTILGNLLNYSIGIGAKKLTLHVSKVANFSIAKKLNYKITTDTKVTMSAESFYYKYDEKTNTHEGLDLCIAKDLSLLMGGELSAQNTSAGDVEFLLTLPYHSGKGRQDKYKRRLDTRLADKRVLLIDANKNSVNSLEKIFLNFKYSVDILDSAKDLNSVEISKYDLIFIDEKQFNDEAMTSLENYFTNVVRIGNFFSKSLEIDSSKTRLVKKPFTQERIYQLLTKIYFSQDDDKEILNDVKVEQRNKLPVYKEDFHDAVGINLESFSRFSAKKILLVEDSFINQKLLISMLGKSGINIIVAVNGEEALEKINSKKDRFDLVLMDINMPIMDGYTATKKIRENSDFDMLPIIALSALTSTDEVEQMFLCGMNGYIPKPLRKEKLYTAFLMFINHEKLTDTKMVIDEKEEIYEGLDIKRAVKQMSNSSELYKEILVEFQDAYGSSDAVLATLVRDQRFEQARMLCLDLKGLCATICADDMYHIATEIHKKITYKLYDIVPKYLPEYSKELEKINRSIDTYASKH